MAEPNIIERLTSAREQLVREGVTVDSREWLEDIHGPVSIRDGESVLDAAFRHIDLVRTAIVQAVDAKQQAEEECAAAKTDFAALDYVVGQACREVGVARIEDLIGAIRKLRTERDDAERRLRVASTVVEAITTIADQHRAGMFDGMPPARVPT